MAWAAADAPILPATIIGLVAVAALGFVLFKSASDTGVAIALLMIACGFSALSLSTGTGPGSIKLLPEWFGIVVLGTHVVRRRRGRQGLSKLQLAGVGLLVGWLVVNAWASVQSSPSTAQSMRLLGWLGLSVLSYPIVAYLAPRFRLDSMSLVFRLGCTFLVVCLCGWAVANVTGAPNIFVQKDYASNIYRLSGLMLEPNLLASLCIFVLLTAYAYRSTVGPTRFAVATTILVACVLASVTRAAWVCLLLLFLIWLIETRRAALSLGLGVVLIASTWILLGFADTTPQTADNSLLGTLGQRIAHIADTSSGTGAARVTTWDLAFSDMQTLGYGGLGLNSFPQRHLSDLTSTNGTDYLGNAWLAALYDSGVFGLALLVGGLACLTLSIRNRAVGAAYIICLIILGASTSPLWYIFPWAAAALLARAPRHQRAAAAAMVSGSAAATIEPIAVL